MDKRRTTGMDNFDFDYFCQLIQENLTYDKISKTLQETYPGCRGFSVASIKLF